MTGTPVGFVTRPPKAEPVAVEPGVKPTVFEALVGVMADVQNVRKGDVNKQQGFAFRGIDAVLNAVGPALRTHRVIVMPEVLEEDYSTVEVGQKRTPMANARLKVQYTFFGPAGDSVGCVVVGEAMDSGDKAVAKAMSVAFRIALLQALALPTDEPDADHSTYERSSARDAAAPKALSDDEMTALAADVIAVESMDVEECRALWKRRASVLEVEVAGTTLLAAITARKVVLDGLAAQGQSDTPPPAEETA